MTNINQAGLGAHMRPSVGTLPLIPVVDELEALEFLVDDDETLPRRIGPVWRHRPSLLLVRARAQFHTAELGRLLDLVREGQLRPSDKVRDSAQALALLINAANLATVLIAHRTAADYRALAEFRRAMRRQARSSGDAATRNRVDIICGGEFVAASEQDMRPARLPRAAPCGLVAREGEAGAYTLDMSGSLRLWWRTGVDPQDLLEGARALLAQVDIWRRIQQKVGEPSYWDDAVNGGVLIAYARLARLALRPARDMGEARIKRDAINLIAPRSRDPDAMRAAVEWAVEIGRPTAL